MRRYSLLFAFVMMILSVGKLQAQKQSPPLDSGAARTAEGVVMFDDFDTVDGWELPIYQYGDTLSGDAAITDGELRITRKPRAKWHSVTAERTVQVRFEPGLAVFFRFRFEKRLLGSDFYLHLNIAGENWVELGVNGEQSWHMFRHCEEKAFDDELFYGSKFIAGQKPGIHFPDGKKTDIRAALGAETAGRIRWDDWRVFGVVWDDSEGDNGRLRVFIDGDEIEYRDLDCMAPEGGIDTRFRNDVLKLQAEQTSGNDRPDKLEIRFSAFADGDLYADKSVNDGEGVRWLSAFASMTPAVPSPDGPETATPADAVLCFDYCLVIDSTCSESEFRQNLLNQLIGQKRLSQKELQLIRDLTGKK